MRESRLERDEPIDIAGEAIDEDDDGEVEGVEFRLDPKDILSSPK